MKKVSEVKDELKALGCHEKPATDLLVACGVLKDDEADKISVGDIWKCRDEAEDDYIAIVIRFGSHVVYYHTIRGDLKISPEHNWNLEDWKAQRIKLIWRDK